ncbi:MAG: four helix bundle protein [Patescibacteria group bacterium]|nr:four helix bundle protein [Patescibacteria group bacterium]
MNVFHDILKKKITDYVLSGYIISRKFPSDERYALTSQCRRAMVSVLLNYVEGFARKKRKVMVSFYEISYGSLQESITTFYLACNLGYISTKEYISMFYRKEELAKMLWSTISNLEK